jgi:hypothetical protein
MVSLQNENDSQERERSKKLFELTENLNKQKMSRYEQTYLQEINERISQKRVKTIY